MSGANGTSLTNDLTKTSVSALVKKLDRTLSGLLDELSPGWTFEALRHRVRRTGRIGNNEPEIITLDGVPIVRIHPMECTTVEEDGRWVMRITQKFERLAGSKADA